MHIYTQQSTHSREREERLHTRYGYAKKTTSQLGNTEQTFYHFSSAHTHSSGEGDHSRAAAREYTQSFDIIKHPQTAHVSNAHVVYTHTQRAAEYRIIIYSM